MVPQKYLEFISLEGGGKSEREIQKEREREREGRKKWEKKERRKERKKERKKESLYFSEFLNSQTIVQPLSERV
jgi:hypothetical protein